MRATEMLKQIIDFQKAVFDNMFNTVTALQEQTEKMVNASMDHTRRLPQEGRKILSEWGNAYKEGRRNYKQTLDELFTHVE